MKKILEYLYIFSKFSTSFLLLISMLILGYLFLTSYKNQEKSTKDQSSELFYNELMQNSSELNEVSKKIELTDTALKEVTNILKKGYGEKALEEIQRLSNQVAELNSKIKLISSDLQKVKNLNITNKEDQQLITNDKSINYKKNKVEIASLIIIKFENNINFDEELTILQTLNDESKQPVFEKIDLVKLKNFRGNLFLKNQISKETNLFLKDKIKSRLDNMITNSLMAFITVEPSKKNSIKNNNVNNLNEINDLIEEKKYLKSYKKLSVIKDHKIFFSETIKQLQIAIEFKKLIKRIS
tara:strand:- start:622 stop:1515 length:894 start_codon:yes stop_codon:yes gene_type:complete